MRVLSAFTLLLLPAFVRAAATEPPAPPAGAPLKVEIPNEMPSDQADLSPGAILRLGTPHGPRTLERSFSFSPNGKYVAAGTVSRHVRIWEVATGKVVHSFGPFEYSGLSQQVIAKSVFSPDGSTLAIAAGLFAPIIDLTTGKQIGKLEGHTHIIEDLVFSRDGKRIVTAAYDQTAAIWDRMTFKRLHALGGFANPLSAAAISPDGATVAAADHKGVIKLWKMSDGSPLCDLAGMKSMALFLRFGDDNKTLLAGGYEDGLVAWDVSNGEVKRRVADMKGLTALSADGTILAAIKDYSSSEPVIFWDVKSGKQLGKAAGNRSGTTALALAPDNRTLGTYGGDGILRYWKIPTGAEINPPGGHQNHVTGVGFSRDGKTIISASEDATARFWDAITGKELRRLSANKEHFHALGLSADGKTLALVGGGLPARYRWQVDEAKQMSNVRFLDIESGKELRSFHLGGQTTGWVRFSGDGREVFALGWSAARFIDVTTGKERNLPVKVDQGMPAGDVSPDGRYAAISTNVPALRQIGKIAYFDLKENKEVFSKTFYLGGYSGLAFAPDSKHLAVAGSRNHSEKDKKASPLQLWEVPTDKAVRHFETDDSNARALVFSRDGRMLASVEETRIAVYEVSTGKRRHLFGGHEGGVSAVAFSRDGRRLASGGHDARALIWDLSGANGKPVAKLEPRDLDRLWHDLASDEAPTANAAIGRLTARPAESVPYLRLRLTVLAEAELKRMEAHLADLDSDLFRVRDKAAKELEKLGEAAVPVLKRAMSSKSVEVRQTAERLLKKIGDGEDPFTSPEARRVMRAIEALERVADAEAKSLLKDLSRRGGKLVQVREAEGALRRVDEE